MAFIDYQKAFDTIWRTGLWLKLINQGISGKFLNIIKNMYLKSKSQVYLNGQKSGSFEAETGVRQGEILSPLLFAFYINDLEYYLKNQGVQSLSGITSTVEEFQLNYNFDFMLDILLLYYADYTIILADTAIGLQFALDELQTYCDKWKLTVNEGKTKVMCITRQNDNTVNNFYYNNKMLEVVSSFVYLGLNFTTRGITKATVNNRLVASEKAMFATLIKCKQNMLPIDISLEMFEKMVIPCMLYGSEIWGFNNTIDLEKLQRKYIKYTLKLKKSTSTNMIYGETGMLPIEYYIKSRMISFWVSLISTKQSKISYKLFRMCIALYMGGLLECPWLDSIKQIIDDCGMSFVFQEYNTLEKQWLKKVFIPKIKWTLKDQILQKWTNSLDAVENSDTYLYYKDFGSSYSLKNYLSVLPQELWIPLCKFRTSNHKLPVEIYSWSYFNTPRQERFCNMCNLNDIGDEYHYIMLCPVFNEFRDLYIPNYYKTRPSVHKFICLMKTEKKTLLIKLAKFVREIMNIIY